MAMGCNKVLERNATILKQAIMADSYDLSSLGVIFREIKALLNVVLIV
jgi:hypothetical protein